jgi:hypothetical protein
VPPAKRYRLPIANAPRAPAPPPENPRRYADGRLTIASAVAIAGTLGHPSKMPGYSYGISATRCRTGSKLRGVPGSVCAGCYALTDWYRTWRPLLEGHARRWAGLRHPLWIEAMVRMIDAKCIGDHRWFRWHDSGDLQGVWHLRNIVEVCRRTPSVSHWLPTRELEDVAEFLRTDAFPPNLTVRLSAMMVDSEPVVPAELVGVPTSTVSSVSVYASGVAIVEGKGSIECRAVEARDNECGDCRACWDRRVRNVNYPAH